MANRPTQIEQLPSEVLEYVERGLLSDATRISDLLTHLKATGHGHISRRQLEQHSEKLTAKAATVPVKTLESHLYKGKTTLSSDDALLAVLGDALEQLDRLGTLCRAHHNSRLERILADSYPSVFAMLKEVSYTADEMARVRSVQGEQE